MGTAVFCGDPVVGGDRVVGKSQEGTTERVAGGAAGNVRGILFDAQSSGFFDAAGADCRSDFMAELRIARGSAGGVAMVARGGWRGVAILRTDGHAGDGAARAFVAGGCGGAGGGDL